MRVDLENLRPTGMRRRRGVRSASCQGECRRAFATAFRLAAAIGLAGGLMGAVPVATGALSVSALKQLSLEQLMDIEVTSVSKRPEKLSETASAIQVVTGDDIRRSAATNVPEALRLAPNLRVSQVTSYGWVVSARGFSGLYANKLLVLIDGRSVYTPLFAGVLWDVQNVLLEDVDRIEVVSGPGGTLWGANAVNGVINITTKSAKDTQGLYVEGGGGSSLEDFGSVRYGGKIGSNLYYRVYGQRFDRDNLRLPGGSDASDAWRMNSGGARLDWYPTQADTVTLQGDLYDGTEHTNPGDTRLNGRNVLTRWTHLRAADAETTVQVYYDRAWANDMPSFLTHATDTYDLDFQDRFPLGERNGIVWGAGYRNQRSLAAYNIPQVAYLPVTRDMELFSGFIQDEITLAPDRTKLTVGTKLEHNVFSGFEVQPSVRLTWTPDERQTVWSAVSRAVRSPSRIDVDLHFPADIQRGQPGVNGGPDFGSENVVAYEAGYRVQPTEKVSLSLATFYNRYDDIYSVELFPGTPTYEIQNGIEGQSWGAELSGSWQAAEWWRLRGGYTWFHKDLWNKPGHSFDPATLGNDPEHECLVQSMMQWGPHVQFDVTGRYVSALPNPVIRGNLAFDVRLAWLDGPWEISAVAQNLGQAQRAEFTGEEIPRSVYGKVAFRW